MRDSIAGKDEMNEPLIELVADCDRRIRRLIRLLTLQSLALPLLGALLAVGCFEALGQGETAPRLPGSLRVTELLVVDPAGVERVRIGGDLPDAVLQGRRVPRGERAAGVLLYDASGQERGGYVTWEPSGNVGLTLDTRTEQVTLFVAGPESGSALQLRHGHDAVELRSDEDGSRLTAVEDGRVTFQVPSVDALGSEACTAYRDARSRLAQQEILDACSSRYAEAACLACLSTEE